MENTLNLRTCSFGDKILDCMPPDGGCYAFRVVKNSDDSCQISYDNGRGTEWYCTLSKQQSPFSYETAPFFHPLENFDQYCKKVYDHGSYIFYLGNLTVPVNPIFVSAILLVGIFFSFKWLIYKMRNKTLIKF